MSLTPAQIALVDQSHAEVQADLDKYVAWAGSMQAVVGSAVATLFMSNKLADGELTHDGLAALAALALTRLAGAP